MYVPTILFGTICVVGIVLGDISSLNFNASDANVDPVSWQLFDFRNKQKVPNLLTTSAGQPVYFQQTETLNTNLLNNVFVLESIKHAVNGKRPNREVFAKATGAHGYFEVTNDVTKYTKAKVFEKIGKRTPIIMRLSTAQIDKGGSDLFPFAGRGLSVKFYTEEGNLDLLGLSVPVYFYKDPRLFREFLHAFTPNPRTNILNPNAVLDFLNLNPVALHTLLWILSDFGLPRGYRHMNGFPCHTFELYNEQGEIHFVKFKILAELGYDSFTLQEAITIGATDPDFFVRDLYNSIERKNYPAWSLEMDVLSTSNLKEVDFDPFDVTRLWPNGTYYSVPIGRLVLNRNVKNAFAEIEQAAYNPTNLVPGIIEPPDQLFRGRVIAYNDAQIHRLGINRNKININCPLHANTYNRDGIPPQLDNEGDAVNFYPNSFNGPIPLLDPARPNKQLNIIQNNAVDLGDSRRFYNEVTRTESQKTSLAIKIATFSLRAEHSLVENLIKLLQKVDQDLAARYVTALNTLKLTTTPPSVVEDVTKA